MPLEIKIPTVPRKALDWTENIVGEEGHWSTFTMHQTLLKDIILLHSEQIGQVFIGTCLEGRIPIKIPF